MILMMTETGGKTHHLSFLCLYASCFLLSFAAPTDTQLGLWLVDKEVATINKSQEQQAGTYERSGTHLSGAIMNFPDLVWEKTCHTFISILCSSHARQRRLTMERGWI